MLLVCSLATELALGQGEVVLFPDAGLESVVRSELGIPEGAVTRGDMLRLTVLNANQEARGGLGTAPITDFEGLQFAANLESLDLSGDIYPAGNWFTTEPNLLAPDFSVLDPLSKLKIVDLSWNRLDDFQLPRGWHSLEEINLYQNHFSFLAVPESLVSLRKLELSGGRLEAIQLPDNLRNLEVLDLQGNALRGLSLPSGLDSLTTLDLSHNRISNFEFLAVLPNLKSLDLGAMELTELDLPDSMRSLVQLDLWRSRLADFKFLSGLQNLEELGLQSCELSFLVLPDVLPNLRKLDIGSNRIRDISFLSRLANLETLALNNNLLTRIELPSELTKLKKLYLRGNLLAEFVLPPTVSELSELSVIRNPIEVLAVPAGFHLSELSLHGFDKADVTRYLYLSISPTADGLTLVWPAGTLQVAPVPSGHWMDIPTATSPHSVSPTELQEYYRVVP